MFKLIVLVDNIDQCQNQNILVSTHSTYIRTFQIKHPASTDAIKFLKGGKSTKRIC